MRFVAGRGAVATEMLAGAPWWKAIGKMLLAGAPWWLSCCGLGTPLSGTLLAGAPWWICWPRRLGGGAGRGTMVDLLARAPRRCCWPRVPWRRGWRHRGRSGSIGKKLQGDGAVHKKTCRGIGVRNLGRCAMIILLLKTH